MARIRIEFEIASVALPSFVDNWYAVTDGIAGDVKCYTTSPEGARAIVRALMLAATVFEAAGPMDHFNTAESYGADVKARDLLLRRMEQGNRKKLK